MNWRLLANSATVSALTTLLASAFGLCAALWLAGLQPRARKIALLTSIAPLMPPAFLATNCWLPLLGATGIWREWLSLRIYSIARVVWSVALMYCRITLLLVLGACQK